MATATLNFEIECDVEGDCFPYRPGNHTDPPEDAYVENVGIISLGFITTEGGRWVTKSLLEGIDVKDPAIQRLFQNILDAHQDAADLALLDAAAEEGE